MSDEQQTNLLEWAHSLPKRVREVILTAQRDGMIADVSETTVRAAGRDFWLLEPNLGKVGVAELERVLRGWGNRPFKLEANADPRDVQIERLKAALKTLADVADAAAQTANLSMMDEAIAEARRLLP